jgi:hypothetical protein
MHRLNSEYEQQWLHKDAPAGIKAKPGPENTAFVPGDAKLKVRPYITDSYTG